MTARKDYVTAEERLTHPIMELWTKKVAGEVFLLMVCFALCVTFVYQVISDITN